jgi:hypothetical protein
MDDSDDDYFGTDDIVFDEQAFAALDRAESQYTVQRAQQSALASKPRQPSPLPPPRPAPQPRVQQHVRAPPPVHPPPAKRQRTASGWAPVPAPDSQEDIMMPEVSINGAFYTLPSASQASFIDAPSFSGVQTSTPVPPPRQLLARQPSHPSLAPSQAPRSASRGVGAARFMEILKQERAEEPPPGPSQRSLARSQSNPASQMAGAGPSHIGGGRFVDPPRQQPAPAQKTRVLGRSVSHPSPSSTQQPALPSTQRGARFLQILREQSPPLPPRTTPPAPQRPQSRAPEPQRTRYTSVPTEQQPLSQPVNPISGDDRSLLAVLRRQIEEVRAPATSSTASDRRRWGMYTAVGGERSQGCGAERGVE